MMSSACSRMLCQALQCFPPPLRRLSWLTRSLTTQPPDRTLLEQPEPLEQPAQWSCLVVLRSLLQLLQLWSLQELGLLSLSLILEMGLWTSPKPRWLLLRQVLT